MNEELNSIIEATAAVYDNRHELIKDIDTYQQVLHVLKKAIDNYGKRGMSVVDDPDADSEDSGDAADQWLKEHNEKPDEASKQRIYSRDWQPRTDYTPVESAAISKFLEEGYSHREAERLAGAHKGPRDYRQALRSGINPSMPSDKMLEQLKGLAKEWLDNARNVELAGADQTKNPMKYAAGQMEQAHGSHVKDYHEAYNNFLASDELKQLKPRERHKAVQEWKNNWKQQNPNYEEGLGNVSAVQSVFADAASNIKQRQKDIEEHIGRGGVSEVADMTAQEAAQHLGAVKGEEGIEGTSVVQDPLASFAAKNPKLTKLLNEEQMSRVKRVDSAAAAQGKVRVRKAPGEPKE